MRYATIKQVVEATDIDEALVDLALQGLAGSADLYDWQMDAVLAAGQEMPSRLAGANPEGLSVARNITGEGGSGVARRQSIATPAAARRGQKQLATGV